MDYITQRINHMGLYVKALCKWILIGAIIGSIGGVIGALFHLGVDYVTHFRTEHGWVLFLLPLAGLLIVAIYHFTKTEGKGTNDIIESVHFGKDVPPLLVPVIFVCTILTHLCGGSAGREGAALQIGGGIGYQAGRSMHLGEKDLPLATLCGMASVFSALFGTPLTATVFALEVISVGVLYYAGLVPGITASLTAFLVSGALGVPPTRFTIPTLPITLPALGKILVLAILCALVSIIFCAGLHKIEHTAAAWFPNPWLRVVAGGVAIIVLTLLLGTRYNGAGMERVVAAMNGEAAGQDWIWKILFTAITIGCGFKGGEVVPSFFIGATFGCWAGGLLGLPAGFGAAIGLVSVFCGAVNCPMASVILSIELFGSDSVVYFAIACAISYLISGYCGLYSSQTILYSKAHAEFINIRTKS